ncbi:hypothetical protein [Cypionkella sp.]|uniref:hypothetical protein n=1 Tax=Cypionkella sp. TaxID=2811411 RepID=UPI0027266967|nr:hypothetical protein [Cypionkella sp.]MDO8986348.1 hypothetical protein [Cypionkella sp.]MDP2050047.1 hypothetical protein [Cypionkella sp.]
MPEKTADRLEARVWVKKAEGDLLVGERVRGEDGALTMIWHVEPGMILEVMWIEIIGEEPTEPSAI